MNRDEVGARFGEGLDEGVARSDHQMHVEELARVRAERLHHFGPDSDVRHEMAVHYIDMDPVAAGTVDRLHLLAELGEIGREDRRRDDDVLGHGSLPTPPGHAHGLSPFLMSLPGAPGQRSREHSGAGPAIDGY